MSQPNTTVLRCKAGRGMFPHEAGILIQGADRVYESMVDRELVLMEEGTELSDVDVPASITVGVIKVNGTKMLVELPRQVVCGGRRIWVSKSEVHS